MGVRCVMEIVVGGAEIRASVFDKSDSAERGEVVVAIRTGGNRSSAEIRAYGRACDLRGIAAAMIAAAENIEAREGA